jgi:hypothetical protein
MAVCAYLTRLRHTRTCGAPSCQTFGRSDQELPRSARRGQHVTSQTSETSSLTCFGKMKDQISSLSVRKQVYQPLQLTVDRYVFSPTVLVGFQAALT